VKKILIAVDLQNDFITGALGTGEAVEMLPRAVRKIKEFDGPVIFTMDTHGENYLETAEGRKLPVTHCVKNTEGWQLAPEIKALVGDNRVVEKPTFGSMELPGLVMEFCRDELPEIEIIGICTDICVISNAMILKAAFPEASITVDSSCCAGVAPESHQRALGAMGACQIDII